MSGHYPLWPSSSHRGNDPRTRCLR
jgi:hypothetical protein